MLGIAVVALMGTGLRLESAAQPTARLSALIEQLELGEPAISDVHWAFIDMEHGPYLLDQLQDRLAEFKPDGSPPPRADADRQDPDRGKSGSAVRREAGAGLRRIRHRLSSG